MRSVHRMLEIVVPYVGDPFSLIFLGCCHSQSHSDMVLASPKGENALWGGNSLWYHTLVHVNKNLFPFKGMSRSLPTLFL